jgi:hypothetical protein
MLAQEAVDEKERREVQEKREEEDAVDANKEEGMMKKRGIIIASQ